MLNSWPISRRIGSGFLVLTALIVALSVFSQRAVTHLGQGYLEYRQIAAQTKALNSYSAGIALARKSAFAFRASPDQLRSDAVINAIDDMLALDPQLDTFANLPEQQESIRAFLVGAEDYRSNFLAMAEKIGAAEDIREDFNARSDIFKAEIENIFALTIQTGTPSEISAAGQTLQAGLSAIVRSKQLFSTGDSSELTVFQDQYNLFEQRLRRLTALNSQDATARQINALEEVLDGYPQLLDRWTDLQTEALALQFDVLDVIGPSLQDGFADLNNDIIALREQVGIEGESIVTLLQWVIPLAGFVATVSAAFFAFIIGRSINRPISRLVATTQALADGNNDVTIEGTQYKHEFGQLARALNVFRDAQIERETASAERARQRQEQDRVVGTMQAELARLAEGDLTTNIQDSFVQEYETMRENFNEAVTALHEAIAQVKVTTAQISDTSAQTSDATSDLSQRTENQAATLEQTAAALDELTASVKSAAEHAKAADASVVRAHEGATKNGEIVSQAVAAMVEIEQSSHQITQVIGVIDEIAFQTNLLALNAGVEAARAGESGKGFAVVASEVRALAQRSADAAKEIGALIANSSHHVQQGTQLVGKAGNALGEIIDQVNEIASMTAQIATSAEEQAIGLSEINIGVNQLDQVTQQNAAMVQESMTRTEALRRDTNQLSALIARFETNNQEQSTQTIQSPTTALANAIADTTRAASEPPHKRKAAGGGGDNVWQDF